MGKNNVNVIETDEWPVFWDIYWVAKGRVDLTFTIGKRVKNTKFVVVMNNGISTPRFIMQCVRCEDWKLRTTDNFTAAHVVKYGGIREWFTRGAPGNHSLMNSEKRPCNTCYASLCTLELSIKGSNKFFQTIANKYGFDWVELKAKFEATTSGAVTFLPSKFLLAQPKQVLTVGVHDLLRSHANTGEPYNQEDHDPDHTAWDLAIANIQQHNRVAHLPTANIEMYASVLRDLLVSDQERAEKTAIAIARLDRRLGYTVEQSGVTTRYRDDPAEYDRQRNTRHVPRILALMQSNHQSSDDDKKREGGPTVSVDEMVDLLKMQNLRCYFCGVLLTFKLNKWTHLSFDREDNSKSHCVSNVRAVCQLHQAMAGMHGTRHYTRAMVMHMVAVAVEPSIVEKRTPEHAAELKRRHDKFVEDGETCAMCEIEVL